MDEVQTGVGATGVMWALERFNLQPPQIWSLSQEIQSAGYFSTMKSFQTLLETIQHLVCDPTRMILAGAMDKKSSSMI